MYHPFQCLATASPCNNAFVLSACGPRLKSSSVTTGEIVSEWSAEISQSKDKEVGVEDGAERPAKKQKTSSAAATSTNIIKLAISPDNRHAISVTDDKCLRVFRIDDNGSLSELSQRFMPKRPCAIQVMPNNTTILCGDKFGDVYSLPLISAAQEPNDEASLADTADPASSSHPPSKPFKPSATNLTVHTQRNRKALESQLKQKNLTSKSKEPLKFEHKLLLGHVSMLTDLTYAEYTTDRGSKRGHIVTADRDEHIRISRSPPQSHVIEGYCLGHKEFVSKLCAVPGTPLLVSGGGDSWVGVWNWPEFRLVKKLPIASTAVSGIWAVPSTSQTHTQSLVLVACEKVPQLEVFEISADGSSTRLALTKKLDHAILDVCIVGSSFVVSLDARNDGRQRLQAFRVVNHSSNNADVPWAVETDSELQSKLANLTGLGEAGQDKGLEDLLYGIENLRKRGGHDEAAEE